MRGEPVPGCDERVSGFRWGKTSQMRENGGAVGAALGPKKSSS
jgi:hypothetical protein